LLVARTFRKEEFKLIKISFDWNANLTTSSDRAVTLAALFYAAIKSPGRGTGATVQGATPFHLSCLMLVRLNVGFRLGFTSIIRQMSYN
jgi:hypothetical protein